MNPSRRRRPLLPYVAVLAILIAAILMRDKIEPTPASADAIERYLLHELEARVGAVFQWENARRSAIERIADEPALRRHTSARLAGKQAPLDAELRRLCADLHGCAVTSADGVLLGSHVVHDVPAELVRGAARGRTVQSRLVVTDSRGGLEPSHGTTRYAAFFATPIVEHGEVRAVLTVRVHPDEELGPILGAHPPGRTGETYAVDPHGFMVTRSRFDAQGEHPSSAPRVLGAPATWLRTPSGQPTRALASLRHSGADIDGYLDYRGVRVVGAWRWIDELGAGVVTEMDAGEARRITAVR